VHQRTQEVNRDETTREAAGRVESCTNRHSPPPNRRPPLTVLPRLRLRKKPLGLLWAAAVGRWAFRGPPPLASVPERSATPRPRPQKDNLAVGRLAI